MARGQKDLFVTGNGRERGFEMFRGETFSRRGSSGYPDVRTGPEACRRGRRRGELQSGFAS
jgi:hypothetical protein